MINDDKFRQLLDRLGLSWQGYARVRKGVKKRICRHMEELGYRTVDDYLHALNNPEILKEVEFLFCVSISRFFRDHYLWQVMEGEIIPDIIRRYGEKINIWSAGCALGQEVYSFAILWDRTKGKFERLPRLHIHATDSNPSYLKKAAEGIYSPQILKGLSEEIKGNYFHRREDESDYCVADYLKKEILWELHDMMAQPPLLGKFQILFLRNSLLTYYRIERIVSVFLKIVDSLDEGGFFIVGRHENLPIQTTLLLPYKGCSYIFQKTETTRTSLQEKTRPCESSVKGI